MSAHTITNVSRLIEGSFLSHALQTIPELADAVNKPQEEKKDGAKR